MTRFIIRRLIQSFFLILGITLITFVITRLAPGGPETMLEDPNIRPEYIDQIREEYGLNDPVLVQYGKWAFNIFQLNFGRSFEDNRPVIDKIVERVPATLQLSLAGYLLGLLGIPLGVWAALHRGRKIDSGVRIFTVIGQAIPHWWLGLMILVFTAPLGLFPLMGMGNPSADNVLLDRLHHLLLPALISAMSGWIVFSRYTRSEMLEVLSQDYVRTARAKGLHERTVMNHAMRNALIPIITVLGGSLAGFFSGAVLLETVFSWPGMGRLAVQAAFKRDYPTVMALTVIFSFLVIIGNLLADIAYAYVDPRVRY
ncbi:MAG TPA: ABC transporter permease [Thermomicrobiales bacterium]|jgi:peptide/nickel transport system permease protein|nr:ABC transporter permease [Thermomicrobiales bacterium]